MRTFFLLLSALLILAEASCPVATSEKVVPTTTTPEPTTTTTVPPTTVKTTTEPKGSTVVETCIDSGYQPDSCWGDVCPCPVISMNSTLVYRTYSNWAASKGNKTYVYPTFGIWVMCQVRKDRVSCPAGYTPETVFFDSNKNVIADFDYVSDY